ncbi:rhamnosyltransferase [Mesorhizobium sp. NBSH29]|uniref:glycosyltransferase family 2 protein n=1 Tax=Mesorhizobium sp. NBSH29 TaxID=2654249 RepID=UPI0018969B87|nr:glycosyltransferase family 2 protein [Mesorhizobium sp. NBSH29]QPC86486.1 rhamnosyltransferase [Mesorhizobium sp. NBSH29]
MKPLTGQPSIVGVIVSYRPDVEVLRQLVEAVVNQVDRLLIVDNGMQVRADTAASEKIEIITLGDNLGIARAQNEGIARARSLGATHVLLLDQDSIPEADMVVKLLAALQSLETTGVSVACVGPNYQDDRHANAKPFVRLKYLHFKRQPCAGDLVEVDFLIASGCLITMSALDTVGPMADDLFIDYVDIEWGLRAQSIGLKSYGVCTASMRHALGDSAIRLGTKSIPVHSPLRQYYNVRNTLWLCRRDFISWQYRAALMLRLVYYAGFYTVLVPPRITRLRMMASGLYDGILNRMGKYRGKN